MFLYRYDIVTILEQIANKNMSRVDDSAFPSLLRKQESRVSVTREGRTPHGVKRHMEVLLL